MNSQYDHMHCGVIRLEVDWPTVLSGQGVRQSSHPVELLQSEPGAYNQQGCSGRAEHHAHHQARHVPVLSL